ncbi:MAG: hypothetical protein WC554_19605 [Clostridia bacterium]|jgi:hypothetical protein
MFNAVILTKRKNSDNRLNPLGKSKLTGDYLYEVEYQHLDIRHNTIKNYKLLGVESEMHIVPWEYANSKNIYDPYNYKEYYDKT